MAGREKFFHRSACSVKDAPEISSNYSFHTTWHCHHLRHFSFDGLQCSLFPRSMGSQFAGSLIVHLRNNYPHSFAFVIIATVVDGLRIATIMSLLPSYVNPVSHVLLRVWVLITGLAGLSASIGAFTRPLSPHKTLYRLTSSTACAEFARMYGTWLLTSTAVRVAYFFDSENRTLLFLVFCTYCIALFHFGIEIFTFQTVSLRPAGTAPLVVASFSIFWIALVAVGIL